MENSFINIKQASKILGVSTLTLRNWDNSGKFPAGRHPISNYRVYKISDIENLILSMGIKTNDKKRLNKNEVKKLIVKHLND